MSWATWCEGKSFRAVAAETAARSILQAGDRVGREEDGWGKGKASQAGGQHVCERSRLRLFTVHQGFGSGRYFLFAALGRSQRRLSIPPRLRAVTRRSGTAAGRAWKLAAQGSGLAARPGAEAGSAAVSAAGGLVGPTWGGGRRVVGPYGKRSGYSRQFAHNCWNFTLGALKPNPGR